MDNLTMESVTSKPAELSGDLFIPFASRRSVVYSTQGIIACTQPLAAQCGLKVLRAGGNAADAAVAVAAGLNMTEPCSTGIGGDMFCLFYNGKTKKISALNGSGAAGAKCSLETIRSCLDLGDGDSGTIPLTSVHSVTVPGAAAGWIDTVESFGSGIVSLEDILAPAIEMGRKGFPVSELAALSWKNGEELLKGASPNYAEMLKSDCRAFRGCRAPRPGEIMTNPKLADTFNVLANEGKRGFYTGRIAEAIISVCQDLGARLELEDLKRHMDIGSQTVTPISLKFRGHVVGNDNNGGVEVWEHPPNGQGIVALMALGILEELENTGKVPRFRGKDHNTAIYLHAVIESLRIAFGDANWWVTDPNMVDIPTERLISKLYLAERAKLFNPHKASPSFDHGSPAHNHSDTVYFAVTDSSGNAISFINSNYAGFGSGIIPKDCGFTLQNRGSNFSLRPDHPNVIAPRKRPYHTIIPAMVTNIHDGSLHSVYGVMGGFMQPQGHVQVLLNMLLFKMSTQAALDAPRFCIGAGMPDQGKVLDMTVYLEEGIEQDVLDDLIKMGHKAEIVRGFSRALFGRGQIISRRSQDGQIVYSAGSDPRGDGAAYPA